MCTDVDHLGNAARSSQHYRNVSRGQQKVTHTAETWWLSPWCVAYEVIEVYSKCSIFLI